MGTVFGTVVAFIFAGFFFWREYAGNRNLEQRLGRVTGQSTPTLEAAGILREPMYPEDTHSVLEKYLQTLPSLNTLFEQAGVKMDPAKFWGITILAAVVPMGGLMMVNTPIVFAIFAGALGALMPFIVVMQIRKRRLNKFGAQLCEAMELVARALRAGHSLAAGMHVVAEEMPDPIASEFGRVWEEQNLGISLEQAMRNLAARVPNLDLKFFVTAVVIQRQTGGDLAEILDKIGYIIRERFKIIGLVKALTGEGRLSGVVLIALPFICFVFLLQSNYGYVSQLWTEPLGRQMTAFALVSIVIGAFAIRKIVDIKV